MRDGDVIAVDSSTTTFHLAQEILDRRNLVVVTNGLAAPGRNAVTLLDTRTWQVKSQRDWKTAPTTAARTPHGTYVLSGRVDLLVKGETTDEFSLDR